MNKIETVQDVKQFLNNNRDKILEHTVKMEDLSSDNEWLQDDEWDEIYKKGNL